MGKVTELDVMLSRKIGEIADADEVIALNVPPIFNSISRLYKNFNQTPDEEVF